MCGAERLDEVIEYLARGCGAGTTFVDIAERSLARFVLHVKRLLRSRRCCLTQGRGWRGAKLGYWPIQAYFSACSDFLAANEAG
jgi:hypothetical protein